MHAPRKEKWQGKFKRSRYLIAAILFHLILFLLIATFVIWPVPPPTPTAEFQKVIINQPPPPPPPPPPPTTSIDPGGSPQSDSQAVIAPVVTPPSLITSQNTSFTMDVSPLDQTLNHLGHGMGRGTGNGFGDGSGPGVAQILTAQLSKLLFRLPSISDAGEGVSHCPLTDDHHLIVHIPDDNQGRVYTCNLQVRGVVEQATYKDGALMKKFLVKGGTPNTGLSNIYELKVDDPPQIYYLNSGSSGVRNVSVINYAMHIDVKNGSEVTLHADSIDSREQSNIDKKSVPDNDSNHPIAVKQPYNGQFIQVDTLSIGK